MDIQALEILSNLAAITTKQGSGDAEVVSGDFSSRKGPYRSDHRPAGGKVHPPVQDQAGYQQCPK